MTKAHTELDVERALRAALSQMGSHVGCAKGPVSGKNTKAWVVENTMSLSWRIGRAVALSRCSNTIDTVAESIIAEVGGPESAAVLFKGKIVGVERITRMGHAYGEVIIESTAGESADGQVGTSPGSGSVKERLIIPFKNENIYAKKVGVDGKEEVRRFLSPSFPPFPPFTTWPLASAKTTLTYTLIPDPRYRTGPRLCHRCAKWRGSRHARVPLWTSSHCPWYHCFREMDVDRERDRDRRPKGLRV